MEQLIVIDWKCLVMNLSHSIRSGNIACVWPTEQQEIAHRVMQRLCCIREEHPNSKIILANDKPPYWRSKYMEQWYLDRHLEPVKYKGNRDKVVWVFQTNKEEMEALYAQLLVHGAASIGAIVVQDQGLEADDIFGVIAKTYEGPVLGITTDSDWGQLIGKNVQIQNLANGDLQEFKDVRVKWVGGDPGDNVPGCPKRLKNGNPGKNWGQVGAIKLIATQGWQSQVPRDHLERNRVLTTLPCPTWDLEAAKEQLYACAKVYEQTDEFWDRYGITERVRAMLKDQSQREMWIQKLRVHLLEKAPVVETEPEA